jgi:Na+-translocating ferredoxin:NAD+ oxidoreductase RNF subunit RnfB
MNRERRTTVEGMEEAVYMVPNPATPNQCVTFDPEICAGCNTCIEACRTDVLVPNPEKGKPPVVLYPEECWFCACCVAHCPRPGAVRMEFPMNQRVGWKRKKTGEYFRIGMKNPPPSNERPPVG